MRDFRGQLQESTIQYYKALSQVAAESEPERSDQADAYFNLAETYYEMGDIDAAVEAYVTSRKRYRELAEEFPENLDYRYKVAATEIDHADMLVFSQRGQEAEQLLKSGLERIAGIAEKRAKNGTYQRGYAYALGSEAERLRTVGKLSEAAEQLAKATKVLRAYSEVAPEDETQENQLRLGRVLLQHAALQSNGQWKFDASLDQYAEAEELLRPLYESDDYFASGGYHLATVKLQQGEVLYHQGRGNDAVDRIIEGRDIILDVDAYYPDVPDYYRLYIDLQNQFGELKIGVPTKAARDLGLEAIQEGIELTQTLLEEMDSQPDDVLRMAVLQKTAGQLYTALEQHDVAEQSFTNAMESLAQFDESQSEERDIQPSIDLIHAKGETLYAVAEAYTEIHQTDKALTLLDEAQQVFEDLVQRAPGLGSPHHMLGQILIQRAQCYLDKLYYVDAMKELDKVVVRAVEISKVPDSKEMSEGYQIVSNAAKALRLVASRAIWTTFDSLLLEHRYEEFLDQLTKYANYNKRDANRYRLATVLAKSIASIKADDKLAPDKQSQLIQQHGEQVVAWLGELWEQGYIKKKKSRLGALISSRPSLEEIQEGEEFETLRDRQDFQQLLKRMSQGN